MHELEFNYENVINSAPMLAESFDELIEKLASDKIEIYSVKEMIERIN